MNGLAPILIIPTRVATVQAAGVIGEPEAYRPCDARVMDTADIKRATDLR